MKRDIFERDNIFYKKGLNTFELKEKLKKVLKPNKIYLLKITERNIAIYEEYRFLKWFGVNNDLLLFAKLPHNVKESFSLYEIGKGKIRIKEV